jgi:hypothetical protein
VDLSRLLRGAESIAYLWQELSSPGGTTPRTPRCTPDGKNGHLIGRAEAAGDS